MANAILGFNRRGFVGWVSYNYVERNIHDIGKAAEGNRGVGGGGGEAG
jgi:hypothetical protein